MYIFAAPPPDWYNVKTLGAKGDDPGDLTGTDDTNAIQAAYDAACATGGTVYFPRGQYKITRRLTPTSLTQEAHVRFAGNPGAVNGFGSRIIGNFSDYLLCTGSLDPILNNDGIPGVCAIDNLGFQNFHATGSAILIGWGDAVNIVNCFIYANNVGIRVPHGICVKCDSCNFTGGGTTDGGTYTGLVGSTGLWDVTQATNCRIAGYDRAYMCGDASTFTGSISTTVLNVSAVSSGIISVGQIVSGTSVSANTRIISLGTGTGGTGTYNVNNSQSVGGESMSGQTAATEPNVVLGCSFETNNTAVKSILGGNGSLIASNQFESNRVSIDWNGAGVSMLSNWISAPNGSAITGILLGDINGGIIAGNNVSATFSGVGIDCSNVVGNNVALVGNNANNLRGAAFAWDVPVAFTGGKSDVWFLGNNNPYLGVVFANLPASPVEGWEFECSDSPIAAVGNFAASVTTGGGSNHVRLRWNGANWKITG